MGSLVSGALSRWICRASAWTTSRCPGAAGTRTPARTRYATAATATTSGPARLQRRSSAAHHPGCGAPGRAVGNSASLHARDAGLLSGREQRLALTGPQHGDNAQERPERGLREEVLVFSHGFTGSRFDTVRPVPVSAPLLAVAGLRSASSRSCGGQAVALGPVRFGAPSLRRSGAPAPGLRRWCRGARARAREWWRRADLVCFRSASALVWRQQRARERSLFAPGKLSRGLSSWIVSRENPVESRSGLPSYGNVPANQRPP